MTQIAICESNFSKKAKCLPKQLRLDKVMPDIRSSKRVKMLFCRGLEISYDRCNELVVGRSFRRRTTTTN